MCLELCKLLPLSTQQIWQHQKTYNILFIGHSCIQSMRNLCPVNLIIMPATQCSKPAGLRRYIREGEPGDKLIIRMSAKKNTLTTDSDSYTRFFSPLPIIPPSIPCSINLSPNINKSACRDPVLSGQLLFRGRDRTTNDHAHQSAHFVIQQVV